MQISNCLMYRDMNLQEPLTPLVQQSGTLRSETELRYPSVEAAVIVSLAKKAKSRFAIIIFSQAFTAWGSFAEYVRIAYAENNLVKLPDNMDFSTAAVLGCRFITVYRGVTAQGKIKEGEWLAVHGCGGVGLSAIMIAVAVGARVIAIDIDEEKLALAKSFGAIETINAKKRPDVPLAIREITKRGVTVSIDALGSKETCANSILSLEKQGRHIQLGLLAGPEANPSIPMGAVIANELEIIGSHGMAAHQYQSIFQLIDAGKLKPSLLINKIVSLEEGVIELMQLNNFSNKGVTIISFDK